MRLLYRTHSKLPWLFHCWRVVSILPFFAKLTEEWVVAILYLLYRSPLGSITRRQDVSFHFYADDCQVYFSFDFVSSVTTLKIEGCLPDNATLMYWVKMNLMVTRPSFWSLDRIMSASQLCSFAAIDGSFIQPLHYATNIGVIFDNKFNMECQVTPICKSLFFHIWNISQIRKFVRH